MNMPHNAATALSYGPDNGLYPKLDNHFYPGPQIHPPQPGLHPEGVNHPMPSSISSNHPPSIGMVPPPHMPPGQHGMPFPSTTPSNILTPGYPDSAHAPFPAHPGSTHHNSSHQPFPDAHEHLSKRDLKKISKAEYKMEKEIYKAQKKAEKKAYKAQKKALKKQGYCPSCNHKGSCSCSSSSSD